MKKIAMMSLFACSAVSVLSAADLVAFENSGFEEDKTYWEGGGTVVSSQKHSGEKSLMLEKGYILTSPGKGKMPVIEPGKNYKFSGWIKVEGCEANGVSVQAVCLGGPNEGDVKWLGGWLAGSAPQKIHDNGHSPALIATGGTHDWKKFEVAIPSAQIPENTKSLMIYLRRDATGAPQGKAYFDDIEVILDKSVQN